MHARPPATHISGYSQARLKRIIAVGSVAASAIALYTIFSSAQFYIFLPAQFYTLSLSLCVLLPLWALTLDLRTRGALGFEQRRSRRYPLSLAIILVLPALSLAARAMSDLNFESYAPLIAAAVLTAGIIFAVFWNFDPQLRGDLNQCVTIAMFALAYSYGALAFADVVFDPSLGHDTQTVIHDKRIHASGGPKGSSLWHQLKVDPDASPAGANWIDIPPNLWDSFHRGDTVCVHVGTGLLAISWYAVGHCRD
jgi:hypothetical protein